MTFRTALAATALGTALLMGGALAGAPGAGAQTAGAAEVAPVSDEELSAFARATLAMAELRDAFIERIEAAETEAEQADLITEGNAAMIAAIKDEPGMTMERYFEIGQAAEVDAGLNAAILSRIEALISGG